MSKNSRHELRNSQLEFAVETLEERKLLAGNVVANITAAGNLVVNGDGASNDIEISIDQDGVVSIVANDGESIDMGNLETATVSGDVRISMRGGDDRVVLYGDGIETGLPVRNINIQGGSGDDLAYVKYSQISGNVSISGGTGDDGLIVWQSAMNNLTMRSGSGNDELVVYDSPASGTVLIASSSGDDAVVVDSSASGYEAVTAKDFTIRTGSGDDAITIKDSAAKYLSEGGDELLPSQFVIAAGGGNDTLDIVESLGDLNINMGGGDDFMSLDAHLGSGRARGGGGFDGFYLNDTDDLELTLISFEDESTPLSP